MIVKLRKKDPPYDEVVRTGVYQIERLVLVPGVDRWDLDIDGDKWTYFCRDWELIGCIEEGEVYE